MTACTPEEFTRSLRDGLQWFDQQKAREFLDMQQRVKDCERDVAIMKEARRKQVETMKTLADLLGLAYPDPAKIIDAVRDKL